MTFCHWYRCHCVCSIFARTSGWETTLQIRIQINTS